MRRAARDEQHPHRSGSSESQTDLLGLRLHLLRVDCQQELGAVETQGGRVCGRTHKGIFHYAHERSRTQNEERCEVADEENARVEKKRGALILPLAQRGPVKLVDEQSQMKRFQPSVHTPLFMHGSSSHCLGCERHDGRIAPTQTQKFGTKALQNIFDKFPTGVIFI